MSIIILNIPGYSQNVVSFFATERSWGNISVGKISKTTKEYEQNQSIPALSSTLSTRTSSSRVTCSAFSPVAGNWESYSAIQTNINVTLKI